MKTVSEYKILKEVTENACRYVVSCIESGDKELIDWFDESSFKSVDGCGVVFKVVANSQSVAITIDRDDKCVRAGIPFYKYATTTMPYSIDRLNVQASFL